MTALKPQFLRVRNWEKFQHYKNRRPPWVRYHVELLDDYELLSLPYATQLLYDRLLLLAARTDNNIPHDPQRIGGQLNIEPATVQESIETLITHGFLSVAENKRSASRVLARKRQGRTTEAETEAEDSDSSDAEADPEKPADISDPLVRLIVAIGNHADKGTERVVRKHAEGLSEGDIAYATECCRGPGVENRAKVAVSALKERTQERSAA
jgi:hypothetical protein